MYAFLFVALSSGTFLVADPAPSPEEVKKELAALQGTWQLVQQTKGGIKDRFQDCEQIQWVIEGDRVGCILEGKKVATFQLVLDPKQTPKALVMTHVADGDPKLHGRKFWGIYSLDGETLTICTAPAPRPQPSKFVSEKNTSDRLSVYQREPPKKNKEK